MKLDTVRGVAGEQGRLYRLWVNGKIKSSEMTRGIFGLREIRCSLEAIPVEPAPPPRPPEIVIRSIPTGYGVDLQDPERVVPLLAIEHMESEKVEMQAYSSSELTAETIVGAPTVAAEPVDGGEELLEVIELLARQVGELVGHK